jgi:hypothetical protein
MIPQSTINACVKAYYGSMESTDYGKIQAVLMAYESMKATPPGEAVSGEHDVLIRKLRCLGPLLQQLNAQEAARAVSDAIEALAKREATPAVGVTDAMVEAACQPSTYRTTC